MARDTIFCNSFESSVPESGCQLNEKKEFQVKSELHSAASNGKPFHGKVTGSNTIAGGSVSLGRVSRTGVVLAGLGVDKAGGDACDSVCGWKS